MMYMMHGIVHGGSGWEGGWRSVGQQSVCVWGVD